MAARMGGYRFMAAGRHGGYRDRDSDFEINRRGFGDSKSDYDRIRVRNHDSGYWGRVGQKDINETEFTNGRYRSTGGSMGPMSYGFSSQLVDREPRELSCKSRSDGASDSEAHQKNNGDEIKKSENGKRKFSPIFWDKDIGDGKRATRTVKARTSPSPPPVAAALPSLLPTPNSPQRISPSKDTVVENSEVADSQANFASESPIGLSPSGSPEVVKEEADLDKIEGAVTMDDDDADCYMPAHRVKSSRWSNEEGEISDDEEMVKLKNKKKKGVDDSTSTRGQRNSVTGELVCSAGNGVGSGDEHVRSSSRDSVSDEFDAGSDDEEQNSHGPSRRSVNMLKGCRSVDEFERLNKIDEGTYGVVFRAKDRKTGEIVALKKVKMEKEREGFPLTALREINILISLHHPSIVDVKEVVVGSNLDRIYMVMEYMEHDLKSLIETKKEPFSQSEVKCLMFQLLEGVNYLHDNWVLHRDLKTSNILLDNQGNLKICDFGLARQYGSPLRPYTQLVVTLWYRAPELLLGAKLYSTAIDMWSLGCIMAELLTKQPLFNGVNEINQLEKIFQILGTPNDTIWPGFSDRCSELPGVKVNFFKHEYNQLHTKFAPTYFIGSPVLSDAGFDLLNRLLTYDPEKRITAKDALNHPWFSEVPLPKSKEFMPTFPAQHDQDRRLRRAMKSPDPLEELRRKELQQRELGTGGLFG